ncbi:MAG TPA: peptide deformylase [Solirubrobacteraceae bacterium]|jgi:peptide deformylase|nr:peptide deformylase [Solirubrobacteraceae bacterium]
MAQEPEQHVDEELADEVEPERPGLDPETAARRASALTQVRQFGDPVLKAKAVPVERFDDQLRAEVARMAGIMGDAIGVGLAATQLGVMHRVLVYKVGEDGLLAALVNPELEWAGDDLEEAEEGCLSLPGVHVDVERPVRVRVRARDEHGDRVTIEASGLEARVIQHEMDHLDGVLILDRIPRGARKEAMRELRETLDARAA